MRLGFDSPLFLFLLLLLPLVPLSARALRLSRMRKVLVATARLAVLTCLALALSGLYLRLPSHKLGVVFLVDASDSVGPEGIAQAKEFVRKAYQLAGRDVDLGVVVFGKEPLIDSLTSSDGKLPDFLSRPDSTATDIPSAMRLAFSMFPADSSKKIVLLSDGNNNMGDMQEVSRLARMFGVTVDYYPVSQLPKADALVDSVKAPARIKPGQSFSLQIVVSSTVQQRAKLTVLDGDKGVVSTDVSLKAGKNTFLVPLPGQGQGVHKWEARIEAAQDEISQNDRAASFTYVESPSRVLVAEGTPGEASGLVAALKAGKLVVDTVDSNDIPKDISTLAKYDAVVLVNVPANSLQDAGKTLQVYVHDLGKGLVAIGGDRAFALGGYFNTPLEQTLPVDSQIRNPDEEPQVAVVMAIDKSGSMAACHCEGSKLLEQYPGGIPKVDIAKESAILSSETLGPNDIFGVVAFDTAPRWVVRPEPVTDKGSIAEKVAGIQGSGGTNIYGGLAEAIDSLIKVKAKNKHVILLTDGWSNVGNYDELISKARSHGITISTVSAAGGSIQLLRSIAEKGGGTFYNTRDSADIPQIVLKETQKHMRAYIQERQFYPSSYAPSPILRGIDSTPPLLGYVATFPKPGSTVALVSPQKDPVLAQWQYGLGRAIAWTSDAGGRWSKSWLGTQQYARLWQQAVDWVMPRSSENVQVSTTYEDGYTSVAVDAVNPSGSFINGAQARAVIAAPSGQTHEVNLEQTAPGRYEGKLQTTVPGSYITSVTLSTPTGTLNAPTSGFIVPYSPEYKSFGLNTAILEALSSATGGSKLNAPQEIFRSDAKSYSRIDLWWPLLLASLLCLLLEVAFRRLRLSSELLKVLDVRRLGTIRSAGRPGAPVDRLSNTSGGLEGLTEDREEPSIRDERLSRLRAARDRARKR